MYFIPLQFLETLELIIDFFRDKPPIEPIVIENENFEIGSSYKYHWCEHIR